MCHSFTTAQSSSNHTRLSPPRCISQHARWWPASASWTSLDHDHRPHLYDHLILASQYTSNSTSLLLARTHQNSLDHDLEAHLIRSTITASMCMSGSAWLPWASASPYSLDHRLLVYLCVLLISVWMCICDLAGSLTPSVSPNLLNYRQNVRLSTRSITALQGISEFTRLSYSGAPRIALISRLLPVQISCVNMGSYIDTQMRIQTEHMSFNNSWIQRSS